MSKKKSKLGSFTAGLKGLFKKSSKKGDQEEFYDEEYFEGEHEEGEGDYDDEDFDDDFSDTTDPSFQQLSVDDIKKSQQDDLDAPPAIPDLGIDDDEEEYSVDSDPIGQTNPSLNEFESHAPTKAGQIKEKLSNLALRFKSQLKGTQSGGPKIDRPKSASVENLLNFFKDINVDEIFDRFFSPQNRPQVHKTYMAALFILGSYFTGRMISSLLTPVPTGKTASKGTMLSLNQGDVTRKKLTRLRENDLFQAPEKSNTPIIKNAPNNKPDFKEVRVCRDADKKSSLGLKLVNTVVLQDSVKSLASVQVRSKEEFLREGDSIPNMIQVGKITRQRLIFKNLKTRKCEFIESKKEKPGTQKPINIVREPKKAKKILDKANENGITNVGNTFKIKKDVRARMLENISEVLTQARAVKIDNPDGSLSFRMQEIVPGSIYSQLNIQEGDVITGLNGKKITNMAELMNLFGQIDKVDHFELTLNRNGIEQNLEYDFE